MPKAHHVITEKIVGKNFASKNRWPSLQKLSLGENFQQYGIYYKTLHKGIWMLTIVSANRELSAHDGGRRGARDNSHEGGIGHSFGGTSRHIG